MSLLRNTVAVSACYGLASTRFLVQGNGTILAIRSAMKPKLSEDKLYLMHDRILCGKLRCCGNTAHFTGKTIGGARCVVLKQRDADEFAQAGEALECESCKQQWKA